MHLHVKIPRKMLRLKESRGESSAASDEMGRSCRSCLLGVQTSTVIRPTAPPVSNAYLSPRFSFGLIVY
jgi:hypothetical protein